MSKEKLGARILWQRAQEYLKKYQPTLVGVAGSFNTSITAQAISLVLEAKGSVRTNAVPLSSEHDIAVAVLGGNHPEQRQGWIGFLIGSRTKEILQSEPNSIVLDIKVEKPGDMLDIASSLPFSVAALTVIDAQDMSLFASKQFIAHEYEALPMALGRSGIAVMNIDDDAIAPIKKHLTCETITVSIHQRADVYLSRITRLGLTGFAGEIMVGSTPYEFLLPHLVSQQQLIALLTAVATAFGLSLNIPRALKRLQCLTPPSHQMKIVQGKNNSLLLDDSFSATPQSIHNAFTTLATLPGHLPHTHEITPRRIAVLGDMADLAALAPLAYETIGKQAAQNADLLLFVGEEMKKAQAAVLTSSTVDTHHFVGSRDVGKWLSDFLKSGDIVLITGGAHMEMQHVVEALAN